MDLWTLALPAPVPSEVLMNDAPNPPSGDSRQANWLRRLLSAVNANRVLPGVGYKLKCTSAGTILEIQPAAAGGGGVRFMLVVSYNQDAANGDYLVCRPAGAAEDGSGDVNVAVEPHLQSGIVSQIMPNGDEWFFTDYTDDIDTDPQQRTSTKGTTVLTEYISPPFLDTDIVPVWPCSNTGVKVDDVSLTLIALTGRQWASA